MFIQCRRRDNFRCKISIIEWGSEIHTSLGVYMDKLIISADEAKKSSFEELFEKLSSDEKGISSSEAQRRLQEYGPNY